MAYDPVADLQNFMSILQTPSPNISVQTLTERGISARVPRSLADLLDRGNNEKLFQISEAKDLDSLETLLEAQAQDRTQFQNLPTTLI